MNHCNNSFHRLLRMNSLRYHTHLKNAVDAGISPFARTAVIQQRGIFGFFSKKGKDNENTKKEEQAPDQKKLDTSTAPTKVEEEQKAVQYEKPKIEKQKKPKLTKEEIRDVRIVPQYNIQDGFVAVPLFQFATGKEIGSVNVRADIFADFPIREDLIHRVARWQAARRRQGTHQAKRRGMVSGSTRKLRNQKGSGTARCGSLRPPHWRKGGVAHPPHPRSHEYDLPKAIRKAGMRAALSGRMEEGAIRIIDGVEWHEISTKNLSNTLRSNGMFSPLYTKSPTLVIVPPRIMISDDAWKSGASEEDKTKTQDAEDDTDPSITYQKLSRKEYNFYQSVQNLKDIDVIPVQSIGVLQIMRRKNLLICQHAIPFIEARYEKPPKRYLRARASAEKKKLYSVNYPFLNVQNEAKLQSAETI